MPPRLHMDMGWEWDKIFLTNSIFYAKEHDCDYFSLQKMLKSVMKLPLPWQRNAH